MIQLFQYVTAAPGTRIAFPDRGEDNYYGPEVLYWQVNVMNGEGVPCIWSQEEQRITPFTDDTTAWIVSIDLEITEMSRKL